MSDNYYADRDASERALVIRQAAAIQQMVTSARLLSETFTQMGTQLHGLVENVQKLAQVHRDG